MGEEMSVGAWLAAHEASAIRLGRPEKVIAGGLAKNFVVYPVISSRRREEEGEEDLFGAGRETRASRRYSEFEEVREALQRKFGDFGMLVPSLPPKAGLFGTSESVVQRRVGALGLFCREVEENGFLATDDDWNRFLGRERRRGGQERFFEYVSTLPDATAADVVGLAAELAEVEADHERCRRSADRLCASLAKLAEDADLCRVDCLREARTAFADLFDALGRAAPAAAHLEDLAANAARQAKELRHMVLVRLPAIEKALATARDKWAKAPSDPALHLLVTDKQAALRDYRAALVHFSLPRYRDSANAARLAFAQHARILANLLGAANHPLSAADDAPARDDDDDAADLHTTAAV